jgi:hypothetical protein
MLLADTLRELPPLQGIASPIEEHEVSGLCPIHEKLYLVNKPTYAVSKSEEKLPLATTLYPVRTFTALFGVAQTRCRTFTTTYETMPAATPVDHP